MTCDPSVLSLDDRRIGAFADFLRQSDTASPFDFCSRSEGFIYPERGGEGVLEMFFFACAHQFGFWTLDGDRWRAPMTARLDGRDLKGSDFLWRACTRALQADPAAFQPTALARQPDAGLDALFHDDAGKNPLPMWPEHLDLIRGYARWFADQAASPAEVLRRVHADARPLYTLLEILAAIPGYAEDPLQKKAMLLAIVLENRPEHFLRVADPGSAVPIIDYHLQRSVLRTGLVCAAPSPLRQKLEARRRVEPAEEEAVRAAAYEAISRLMARSGLSAAAVDWFFFQNRTRCPETTEPDCPACPVQPLCARETRLFQPVFRTTAY
jgi:hypothetical protein